jgi:bilirubin oxidase
VITVNGVPWPFQQVEPRKYKFRLLDASVSRSFKLYLVRGCLSNIDYDH